MLLSGSHMSKQGYLTQCSQCFVCSQNYQVWNTQKYCKEGYITMVKTPISKSKISIHIKFSVLHLGVHLRHHRQSERHDAQPRRGIFFGFWFLVSTRKILLFLSFVETQVTYTAVQNTDLFCWDYGVESVLSYLPLSHVAGQMMDVFLIMSKVLETLLYFISDRCLFKYTFQGWDVLFC